MDHATTALLDACGPDEERCHAERPHADQRRRPRQHRNPLSAPGTGPRVAVGPGPEPWAAEAIPRGGGQVVGLDEDPMGLVGTDGGAMDALRAALATRPGISWVQLPQAGAE